jgi:tRNA(Ile)-lysidine synthase
MNYIVAVSGGVDSVVLLDMLSKTQHKLIVAHVDHGIRGEESTADARFVAALARRYQLPFVSTELHLGAHASEETAREKRYEFLFGEAEKYRAVVVTAHHRDDIIETITLNLTRGTGWRGLAVLARKDIERPLLDMSKAQLYAYALAHHLEWVEDVTNHTDVYLRNRIRTRLGALSGETKDVLAGLRRDQLILAGAIDHEAARRLEPHHGDRYFFSQIDHASAMELLRMEIQRKTGRSLPRPQLERALHAIKVARTGTRVEVGEGVVIAFRARNFDVTVV